MEDYIKPRDIVLCGNFSFKFLIGFLLYTGCPIKSFPIWDAMGMLWGESKLVNKNSNTVIYYTMSNLDLTI